MEIRKLRRFLCIVIGVGILCLGNISSAEVLDKVIVKVNSEVITQREFDRVFIPVKTNYEANFKGEELEKRIEEVRGSILQQLINTKLAVSLAKKQKVKIDESELQSRIDKIKSYYGADETFLQALGEKGTNLSEFKSEIREQMMAQKIVEQEVASRIVVTPAEINDIYQKNKEKMVTPRRAKIRGILIRKKEGTADDTAKSKMDEVYAKLEKGRNFNTLAKNYSEGPYAEKSGDMGFVVPGQLMKEMDTAIFSTKKGNTTDIVETRLGYHVFLVEDIEEPKNLQLEEVSDFLRGQLFKKKFEEALKKWLEEKRKNAYISYK